MSKSAKLACALGCALVASTPAFSADSLAQPSYKAPAVPPQVVTWTGAYIGATAGYGWTESASTITAIDTIVTPFFLSQGTIPRSLNSRFDGFIGGAEIGYNWQIDRWVAGLETDLSYSKMGAGVTNYTPEIGANPETLTSHNTELSWFGTARARLGYLVTPETLFFATGGLAYGHVKVSSTLVPEPTFPCARNALCSAGSASETRIGWAIGGGVESKIASNWTAKVEYLHFDLGTISDTTLSKATFAAWPGKPIMGVNSNITGNIVRIGVNYQL